MVRFKNLFIGSKRLLLKGLMFAGVITFLSIQNAAAGVLVSPTVVFISDKSPTGRMTLLNNGDTPQEVTVYFSYGLPVSDSLGNISVVFQDSAVTDPRSCLDWVRAFPRKVIIEPGESQIVRFMVRAPKNLPDGEYWARIMVQSQAANVQIPVSSEQDGVRTHLNMITELAIMLKYRTGDLVSSLELRDAYTAVKDTLVEVMLDMVNKGNVSYMGMLECRLLDSDMKEISSNLRKLAVYREMIRRIDLKYITEGFKPPFHVEIRINSEGRNDITPEDMIIGNIITRTVAVK